MVGDLHELRESFLSGSVDLEVAVVGRRVRWSVEGVVAGDEWFDLGFERDFETAVDRGRAAARRAVRTAITLEGLS